MLLDVFCVLQRTALSVIDEQHRFWAALVARDPVTAKQNASRAFASFWWQQRPAAPTDSVHYHGNNGNDEL